MPPWPILTPILMVVAASTKLATERVIRGKKLPDDHGKLFCCYEVEAGASLLGRDRQR